MTSTLAGLADTAAALDAADPLRDYRCRFLRHGDPGIVAYLDGNSLPAGLWRRRRSDWRRSSPTNGPAG